MLKKLLLPLWIVGAVSLLLYSFTQIDLSLTLSQASFWQVLQKNFQYIGWFNRPLSTYLYLSIISSLFALYFFTIWLVSKGKLDKKNLWKLIITIAFILLPSYNAFSYDLFNYIFDARIVTHYGLSPYEFKALDFSTDPMLSFMRSTHRVYPYGPSWLGFTVPLTFIGNEIFLFTFYLFKSLSIAGFLGTVYFVKKIAEKIDLKNQNLAVVLFALNPLVIIESLVSAHNETIMMLFATMSVYFLLEKKRIISSVSLLVSIGVKYATAVLFPIYILKLVSRKTTNSQIILAAGLLMIVAVIITSFASGQNKEPEFQPWYLLMAAPFVLLSENRLLRILFICASFFSTLTYIPFLYNGVWPVNVVQMKNTFLIVSVIIGFLTYSAVKFKKA